MDQAVPPPPYLQDACLLLDCSNPLKLGEAIKPLQDIAALVPRLQRFADEVCYVRPASRLCLWFCAVLLL